MEEDDPATQAPPLIARTRSWPTPLILALGFLAVVGLGLLFLFDPARHAFYPVCLFKKMTGYDCPGCGGLRSVHQLLRGDVGQAFRLNAMVVIALPLLGFWAIRAAWRTTREDPSRKRPVLLYAWLLITGIILFGVVRNLPVWPFGVTPM